MLFFANCCNNKPKFKKWCTVNTDVLKNNENSYIEYVGPIPNREVDHLNLFLITLLHYQK